MVSDIESKTIDWLRFPCAFLVVVIHVFGYIGGAIFLIKMGYMIALE